MLKKTFRKSERLHKKKHIEELFKKGSYFYLYPLKIIYLLDLEPHDSHQILISVSKRNFKRAVDRNKLKRRIREAYRTNKALLGGDKKLRIAYIYTSKKMLSFNEIQKQMLLSMQRLNNL